MSLNSSKTRLAALTRELTGRWAETKDVWTDAKSREFEAKYMEELLASVNSAFMSIDNLDRVITKVRNDCD